MDSIYHTVVVEQKEHGKIFVCMDCAFKAIQLTGKARKVLEIGNENAIHNFVSNEYTDQIANALERED